MEQITVRLPEAIRHMVEDHIDWLRECDKYDRTTISDVVRRALIVYFETETTRKVK